VTRVVAAVVEHDVPGASFEPLDAVALVRIAVADDLLELREQLLVRAAAVEQRDGVAVGLCLLDERRSDEARPAEDQDLELRLLGRLFLGLAARAAREQRAGGDRVLEELATIGGHEELP
jgi:hypothetical protein